MIGAMPTSQDLHDRIAGQNVPKRFLANVARNGSTTVLEWKDSVRRLAVVDARGTRRR